MNRFIGLFVGAAALVAVAASLTPLGSDELTRDQFEDGRRAMLRSGKPTEGKGENDKGTDILKEVVQWNSDKFAAPPAQFRQGHVTVRPLDAKALTKVENGFHVSLPSNAPIPTPTVYKGHLYVSGGFHSKEFYCLKADTGELVWGVSLDDDGPSAAVCADDVVVFNTESCTIFALDAKTGKHLWSHWLGDPLTSTPTIANGLVFTSYPAAGRGAQQMPNNGAPNGLPPQEKEAVPDGLPPQEKQVAPNLQPAKAGPACSHVLAAFELKTGKIVWQRWIDSDVMTAPVASDRELYAASFAGIMYKFNQGDGKVLSAVHSRATSAPVVVGKEVYVTRRTDDGKGDARECIAGGDSVHFRWAQRGADRMAAYIDHRVQLESKQAGEAQKLDAGNGFGGGAPAAANPEAAKSNIGLGNVSTMQAFQGSRLLNLNGRNFNCMGDEVVCTDPASGKNLWTHKLKGDLKTEGGFLAAPPATAGGMLFVVTLQGDLMQMDPRDGKVVKTYKIGHQVRFQPAVEGGKIYVGTQDGKIVCIDTGDPKFTGWSCWGGNAAHSGVPAGGK